MKNAFRLMEDKCCYEIIFKDGSSFRIDKEDFEKVSAHTWFKGKRGYPVYRTSRKSVGGPKCIPLHRFLLNPPKGYDVDHISGDKMDNRRCNLRVCSHQENMFNQRLRYTNTTGYYGVSYFKSAGKYEAYVNISGKKKYLGLYATAEEAAVVRDKAASLFFGEFARLNFPGGEPPCAN